MFQATERIAYLSKVAQEKPELRFKDLYNIIKRPEFLLYAYHQIARNKGSKTAGIDKITRNELEGKLERTIQGLSQELHDLNYTPLGVRRVEIPKSNGGKRPLGIPALKDSIVQSAVKLLLEAIYESKFSDSSHGFRPKRSCQTAINYITVKKYDWVNEGDIKGCFDNIKHGKLLEILRYRIADEKLINLINKFLKSGYQLGYGIDGKLPVFATKQGAPQGGIVSPILANIYLNEFDKYMESKLRNFPEDEYKLRSSEYLYYANRLTVIRKAIQTNKFPLTISERNLDEESNNTGLTLIDNSLELEDILHKALEERKKYSSKENEYKALNSRIFYLRKYLKEDKYPVRIFANGRPKGNKMKINNREEAVKKIRELKKDRKKSNYYDKEKYFQTKTLGYIRYADDFVILMGNYNKKEAVKLKAEISEWFTESLNLTLSEEKTKITHSTKGFTFLGYDIIKRPNEKDGIGYKDTFSRIYVPNSRIKRAKERIDFLLRAHFNSPPSDLIINLNRFTSGWSNYYKIANNWHNIASKLYSYLYWKVLHWFGRKYKCSIPEVCRNHVKSIVVDRKNWKRIVDYVEDKPIILKQFRDYKYTTPYEVATKIMNSNSDISGYQGTGENYDMLTARIIWSGGSPTHRIQLEETQGAICYECGDKEGPFEVHHIRKVNRNRKKKVLDIIKASNDIPKMLLCIPCHNKVPTT
ncbi:hypothetical protein F3K44_03680 [Bacillus megaterium]|nr:hypothetical protein [Priestia megaterium]